MMTLLRAPAASEPVTLATASGTLYARSGGLRP